MQLTCSFERLTEADQPGYATERGRRRIRGRKTVETRLIAIATKLGLEAALDDNRRVFSMLAGIGWVAPVVSPQARDVERARAPAGCRECGPAGGWAWASRWSRTTTAPAAQTTRPSIGPVVHGRAVRGVGVGSRPRVR